MKFYALLLAVVCIMSSVEANETFESSELASGRCKAVARKFVKGWYKLDTNRNGKLTWTEMYVFYVRWARAHIEAPVSAKTTFVPITTDRGLCGGVNINLTKELAKNLIPNEKAAGASVEVVSVGDKGRSQVKRFNPEELTTSITGLFAQIDPNFGQASCVAEQALKTDADKYVVLYQKYVSAVNQKVTPVSITSARVLQSMEVDPLNDFEIESAREDLVNNYTQFCLATTIYAALLDGRTSEIASKMAAMDNATRNCESLVEKLQISYNKARQSIITTELIEIISGAESLKDA